MVESGGPELRRMFMGQTPLLRIRRVSVRGGADYGGGWTSRLRGGLVIGSKQASDCRRVPAPAGLRGGERRAGRSVWMSASFRRLRPFPQTVESRKADDPRV